MFAALLLVAQPQITFDGGAFVLTDGQDKATVPLSAADPPKPFKGDKLNMRIGDTLITFDSRGLGIQYRSRGGFTSLAYLPTSPKLFSADEIRRNAELAASGERSMKLSAVSGFEVVKDKLYMLLRWDDKAGKPWLEALVGIDTSGDAPKIDLLGRFGGFSFTDGPVCDELYSSQTKLFVVLRGVDGLAIGTCDTVEGKTAYKKLGPIVDECHRMGSLFYTLAKAPHGLNTVGIVNPVPERYRAALETRGEVLPSPLASVLVVKEDGVRSLFSVFSGAKLPVEEDAGFADTPYGVLVWSPRTKPTTATLRETDGWRKLSEWKKPAP